MNTLELAAAPEDAARLLSRKPLAGLRAGRARRRAVGIVWHDTADGTLARDGLALAEVRGGWRLEWLLPHAPARPSDGASVSAVPGGATPRGATPAGATPAGATPRGATPAGATPAGATPRGATPAGATPAGATPAGATKGGADLRNATPGDLVWPPGAPAPVIAQAAALERIGHALPAGLIQAARFDGRASMVPIEHDGARVIIEVLEGTVGWARRKRPACRVTLTGDETQILTLAATLADSLHLAVPTASLAAEARAVATGGTPPPRHHGSPALPSGLTVAAAFGCVLRQLADVILFNAPLAASGRNGPDPVHEMRVAVRRLRSTMALFRPAVGCPAVDAASASLKVLADRLAPARDWDVFVAETAVTVAEALPDDTSLRRLRAAAERRRRQAYAALRDWLQSPEFRRLGITLAGLAGGTAWRAALDQTQQETLARDLEHFARHALARRLRRLTAAGAAIEHLDTDALHAIRLRAKRMRYAAEVLAPLYPGKTTRRFLRRLMQLQDRLGHLNDGSVANMLLAQLGTTSGPRAHAAGLVRGFLAARNSDTRSHIARAWNRFHRLDPFWR